MQSKRHSHKVQIELLGYSEPTPHYNKRWYVEFFYFSRRENREVRKRYYIDMSLSDVERRHQMTELMEEIRTKLKSGWLPVLTSNELREFTSFDKCLEVYEKQLKVYGRVKTRQSYQSHINVLRRYMEERNDHLHRINEYNERFVSAFLDWLILDCGVSARTRNNYRGWCQTLGEFFVERRYLHINPVTHIKNIKESEKYRQPLSKEMLIELKDCLEYSHPAYYLACCMMYYTLIRPTELSNLRVGDIDVEQSSVFVSRKFSKNRHDSNVALNSVLLNMIEKLELRDYPSDYFLFSSDFLPGKQHIGADHFNKEFTKLRMLLGWGNEYKFYSLKDAGIRDLANAKGIVVAKEQARHRDISTTNKYLQGHDTIAPAAMDFVGDL